ncbi:MAG: IS982 family transposase [Salinibacter sp.]
MTLDVFIVEVFCLTDDLLADLKRQFREQGQPLRSRGPDPTVDDSVVLACEFIGEFLQKNTDSAIFRYFRRHHEDLFPKLQEIHRTTFVRQSANLWAVKAMLHRRLLRRLWRSPRAWVDPRLSAIDSFPVPVCRFIRASQCSVFEAEAAFGFNETTKQTMYGFHGHVEVAWPGVITSVSVAPANEHDATVAPEVLEGGPERGGRTVLGDQNYWSPQLDANLGDAIDLEAPSRKSNDSGWPPLLVGRRRRVETAISQLCQRYGAKEVYARDRWHLTSRWMRKICSHTIGVLLCQREGLPPLSFSELIED